MVVANKSGQLANRLFLFGHLIAFVKEQGGTILNPTFDEYTPHFQSTRRDLLCKFPPPLVPLPAGPDARRRYFETASRWAYSGRLKRRPLRWLATVMNVSADQVCNLSENPFRQLASEKKVLVLFGWNYRSYAAFDKHAALIRQLFQPIPAIQKTVNALIAHCRTEGEIIVGVHIRGGDYKEHRQGRFYYEPGQYADFMRATAGLFPDRKVHFLICSNETVDLESFNEFSVSLGTGHLVEDLYSFAKCDYLVGPPSTYTMWASFAGQVPLYQVFNPHAAFSLADFQHTGGNCDVPEDRERWVEWPQ